MEKVLEMFCSLLKQPPKIQYQYPAFEASYLIDEGSGGAQSG